MKHPNLSARTRAIALLVTALSTGSVMAQDTATQRTREEVRQELEEAKRMGEIPASDESGLLLREEFPERYPPKASSPSRTREEVRKELEEARRAGKMPTPPTD
jgi:hypothetical protein